MNHLRIAARLVEARRKKKKSLPRRAPMVAQPQMEPETVLKPPTEYSCRMEISLTADFEGEVAKSALVKKLKNEIISSIKSGMGIVARELQIQGTGVVVKPLNVECAVNDVADLEDDQEIIPDDADLSSYDAPAPTKKKRR